MVRKKSEDKETKSSPKKTNTVKSIPKGEINIKKFSIIELFEKNNIKPLDAVGFLEHYGLTEIFEQDIGKEENIIEFSNGEFKDMFERYMKREI